MYSGRCSHSNLDMYLAVKLQVHAVEVDLALVDAVQQFSKVVVQASSFACNVCEFQ